MMKDDRFSDKLVEILQKKSMTELIRIPGVYEIMAEEFNNEVLTQIGIDDIMDTLLRDCDLAVYPAAWPRSLKKLKWRLDRLLEFYKKDTGEDFPWDDSTPVEFSTIDNTIALISRQSLEDLPYTELCPHCENEVGVSELKGKCILCGKELIACNMCLRPEMTGEEGGCQDCEHGSRMLLIDSATEIPVQFYTEVCAHCMSEIDIDQLVGKCHVCGKELVVCSECRRPYLSGDDGSCKGCEHGSRMLHEEGE